MQLWQMRWTSEFYISGIDSDEAFIGQKREQGDIFSILDIPQDYCSSLALNTNGSIFDSGHLLVGSVRHQHGFMDSFVGRVQQKESQCQVCSCELNQYGVPSSVCRRCDMQSLYYKVEHLLLLLFLFFCFDIGIKLFHTVWAEYIVWSNYQNEWMS